MTHRHAPLQARGDGPGRDLAQLEAAEQAEIMQVDVDAGAAPLGDGEDGVEMPVNVAVDPGRVEAADQIGAVGDRGIEQLGRARRGEDAALGKRHQLDVDQRAVALAQLDERMQAG